MSVGGRGVWNRKTRVDEARSIDILDLQRKGVFSRSVSTIWKFSWSRDGKEVASVSYRVEFEEDNPSGLRFIYSVTNNKTGEKKDYNYTISVVPTPCNYGGQRWWYRCPLIVNGRSCERRCRIIYMPPDAEYFGCRECHQLTYESRQRHREAFYEGFEKPYMAAKAARESLSKAKSWEKKETLWQKIASAHAAIENFEKANNPKTKIIYKEE
jgi:hypothetical protein